MKRKAAKDPAPLVPQTLMERAKKSLESDTLHRHARCRVCGDEVAPFSQDELCWVCRRLKISAWGDTDTQMTAQE